MSNNGARGGTNQASGGEPTSGNRSSAAGTHLDDEMRYCERCGISFLWTVEEQIRTASSEQGDHTASRQRAPGLCPGCRTLLPTTGRERGMVKWYNIRKRYGFIVRHNQPDLFVPAASLHGTRFLQTGDLVEFTVGSNSEGPIAAEVRLLAHG